MKYLFGPVNSRRLGISLGIDLVNYKTCTLDCIYCESGSTTNLTENIEEYVPVHDVIKELDDYLETDPELDVITFSGSGEPTLYSHIGDVIDFIKDKYPKYRVIVLTNGTLLWKEKVRSALLNADEIVPSLDAVSESVFKKMLRPSEGVSAKNVISGIKELRKDFTGKIVIEVFIIPGINDNEEELLKIREAILEINPDSVQLNKLDRPGTVDEIKTASMEELYIIKELFFPLDVQIVGDPGTASSVLSNSADISSEIMSTIKRRPSTIDDLSHTLGVKKEKIKMIMENLIEEGRVEKEAMDRGIFYKAGNKYDK